VVYASTEDTSIVVMTRAVTGEGIRPGCFILLVFRFVLEICTYLEILRNIYSFFFMKEGTYIVDTT